MRLTNSLTVLLLLTLHSSSPTYLVHPATLTIFTFVISTDILQEVYHCRIQFLLQLLFIRQHYHLQYTSPHWHSSGFLSLEDPVLNYIQHRHNITTPKTTNTTHHITILAFLRICVTARSSFKLHLTSPHSDTSHLHNLLAIRKLFYYSITSFYRSFTFVFTIRNELVSFR